MGTGNLINKKVKSQMIGTLSFSIVMILTVALGALFLSWMISADKLDVPTVKYAGYIILAVAASVGNFISIQYTKRKNLISGIVNATVYLAVLVIVNMLLFDGIAHMGWGSTLVGIIAITATTLLSMVKPNKSIYRKMRYR